MAHQSRSVRRALARRAAKHSGRARAPAAQPAAPAPPLAAQPAAPAQPPVASAAPPKSAPVSDARAAANRANAQHSTGPRSPEGKARSSRNALKHGIFSGALRVAGERLREDCAAFEALQAELSAHYAPAGPDERLIVDRLATTWWLLARLRDQGQRRLCELLDQGVDPQAALCASGKNGPAEAMLERSLLRLHRNLAFLQKWRLDAARRRGDIAQRQAQAARRGEAEAQRQVSRESEERHAEYNAETERQVADWLRQAQQRRNAEAAAAAGVTRAVERPGAGQPPPFEAPSAGTDAPAPSGENSARSDT